MVKPQFSVVIPLYNKQNSISKTLDSVLQQQYPASEIIVVDDGSTDVSLEMVKQKSIPNLKIIQQKNQGVSAARNTGIKAAKYDYIAFLDADDQWLPLYLDEISMLINKYPSSLMYACSYQCKEKNGEIVDANIRMEKTIDNQIILNNYFEVASKGNLPFMISSTVVHKDAFENIGLFPVGESMGEDQDFFCRSAMYQPIAYSKNMHLIYSRDTENRACDRNIPDKECPFSKRVFAKSKKVKLDKTNVYFIKKYCASHLLHLVRINLEAGNLKAAKNILYDKRCLLKPAHFLYFYTKLKSKEIIKKIYWATTESKVYKNS